MSIATRRSASASENCPSTKMASLSPATSVELTRKPPGDAVNTLAFRHACKLVVDYLDLPTAPRVRSTMLRRMRARLIALVACASLSGCTLVGLGIGAAVDHPKAGAQIGAAVDVVMCAVIVYMASQVAKIAAKK